MDLLEALILGILQGLTEFLPVSSSGHIELAKALLGIQELGKEDALLFTIVVHGATALSTVFVFRRRIGHILANMLRSGPEGERDYALKIILSMLPVTILGLFFKEEVESFFEGRVALVGVMLLITGILLFISNNVPHGVKRIAFISALILGVAQAMAVMPGISRSGATISTALLLGISRERSAEFSFIMVLPPILGATLLEALEFYEKMGTEAGTNIQLWPVVIGAGAAFLAGVLACKWMVRLVARAQLTAFGLYCSIVGIAAIGSSFYFL